jgi:hypothetical protein
MRITPEETIEFLKNGFSPYNVADLILKLSALRLLPENGEKVIRLDLFLHVASSLTNSSVKKITRDKLFSILNSTRVTESFFKFQEDPSTSIFCEEISFYGGGYRVFPGYYSAITYQLKNTFYAISENRNSFLSDELKRELVTYVMFVLNLSEAIAIRADIKRNTDIKHSKKIFIPDERKLSDLSLSLIYKQSELEALANEIGIHFDNINWLFSKIDSSNIENYKIESGPLILAPIFSYNGYYVVTDPSSLLNALRNKILDVVYGHNLQDQFNESYVTTVWENTRESLFRLGFDQRTYIEATKVSNAPFIFDTFKFDEDKLAIVFLLFDDRKTERSNSVEVDLTKYKPKIDWVIDFIYSTPQAPNEIFFLYIYSNYERSIMFEASFPEYKSLMLSAENLECISFLETKNELFLYKFALAKSLATQLTRFTSFDKLAEYGLFKKYNDSFNLMDDGIPFVLYISDDYARSVRREMRIKYDIHSVYVPFKNAYVDVMLMHEQNIPFYAPVSYPHNTEFLIESFLVPIWLNSKHLGDYSNVDFRRLVIEMIDNLAYWIIELKPSLEKYLTPDEIDEYLFIEVLFDQKVNWGNVSNEILKSTDFSFIIETTSPRTITFIFGAGLNKLLSTADNSGEREIIASFLKVLLGNIIRLKLNSELLASEIEEITNRHIPLGKKKKIGVYDTSKIPELNPYDITKPRVIDEIDTNLLLDELGAFIIGNELRIGENYNDQYHFIRDHIVPFFITKLTNELKKYDKKNLLDYLIRQNESLIHEKILHEIQLPMRIEIANKETVLEDFKRSYSKIIQSSPACRFLIEYSLGVKIQGIKRLSNFDYENLLAISNEIIHWGFIGDLLNFNLTNIKLVLLKSNRLYVESKDYNKAYEIFNNQLSDYNIEKFDSEFKSYWVEKKETTKTDEDKSIEEFDREFKAEFGFTLSDLIEFERKIFKYCNENNTSIITIKANEFKTLFDKIITSDALEKLLSTWVITERESFLEVPNLKLEHYNFYPWRFNRQYSYIRRPILKFALQNELYYKVGLRHLKIAVDNFTALLKNNRLINKLKNQNLKKILSEFSSISNINFVKKVKIMFENHSDYDVYENVRKIGKTKIMADNGNDLGDIDILVIDRRKYKILFIECKDLLLSRTPYEMHSELTKVFNSDNSQMKKHLLRLEWGVQNIKLLVQHFNLDMKHKWKVKAYFVSSTPLFSPLITKIKHAQYFSFDDLKKKYSK